jgi:hypothetical protein
MGYRFELRKLEFNPVVKRNGNLIIRSLWANVGVAPIYHNYPLVIRLVGAQTIYTFKSRTDIRSWLPDIDILIVDEFMLPSEVVAGEYSLELGIETGLGEVGNIKLAIEGEEQGYYPMGQIRVIDEMVNSRDSESN